MKKKVVLSIRRWHMKNRDKVFNYWKRKVKKSQLLVEQQLISAGDAKSMCSCLPKPMNAKWFNDNYLHK